MLSVAESVSVPHPLQSGSLCVALLHYIETLLMLLLSCLVMIVMSLYVVIKQSFVPFFLSFFLKWGLGVHQPGWDVERAAQGKRFGNRCSRI